MNRTSFVGCKLGKWMEFLKDSKQGKWIEFSKMQLTRKMNEIFLKICWVWGINSSSLTPIGGLILSLDQLFQTFWLALNLDRLTETTEIFSNEGRSWILRKSAYPLHYNHRLLVWAVRLGTSVTQDISGFYDPQVTIFLTHGVGHYSKHYMEFLKADAFE